MGPLACQSRQAALALSWILALPWQPGVRAGMGVSIERRVRFQIIGMNMVMLVCGKLHRGQPAVRVTSRLRSAGWLALATGQSYAEIAAMGTEVRDFSSDRRHAGQRRGCSYPNS